MALEEPPSTRLIMLATVAFVALAVAFFLLPRYDEHKGRQHWDKRYPGEPTIGLLSDREFCAEKFHRETTGVEPSILDEALFALKPEERLGPCMEQRGWVWQAE
jgi:hypothetical protein